MSHGSIEVCLEKSAKLNAIHGIQNPEDFLSQNNNLGQRKTELLRKVLQMEQEAYDSKERLEKAQSALEEITPVSSEDLDALKRLEIRQAQINEKQVNFANNLRDAQITLDKYNDLLKLHNSLKASCKNI